ncbi:MAG: hypothetical protein IJK89_05975 [Clostridia bacterium]|nr:hypothetical protein [Clostridia bacterium]
MTIEVLFAEVCNLCGDAQNAAYLKQTLPDAEVIDTSLPDRPFFADHTPDMIYMGNMSERIQRRVVETLRPYRDRLQELIDGGTVMLFTGNAWEVLTKHISYVTEKIELDGLGLLDLTVKTDWFDRYNGKVLGRCGDIDVIGFRSQFSMVHGDNSQCAFLKVERGIGVNPESKYEGVRVNNLFGTAVLGPILPNNPLFTEYLISLTGTQAQAAFREQAMAAYEQRLKEFRDPKTEF